MAAITATFWTFAKKENSTAQPTTAGSNFTGEFKTGFSLLAPVIKLYGIGQTDAPTYNYCYIDKLHRYYTVNGWNYAGGFWYADLQLDVLASYKTEIGAQNLYVVRADSLFDEYVVDTEYPTKAECTVIESSTANNPFGAAAGSFIVGVVGGYSGAGAISYYAMSEGSFASLIAGLLGDLAYLDIDPEELSEELQKALINPSQYINSCLWVPVDLGNIPGSGVSAIPVGWWSIACSAVKINPFSAKYGDQITLTVPKHPQAATRGKYLNISPYSEYSLNFYPFGTFALDSIRLQDQASVVLRYLIDICTGNAVLYAVDGSNNLLRIASGKFGVPIPTGQISAQIGTFSGMASTAGLAAAAGAGAHIKSWFSAAKTIIGNLKTQAAGPIWQGVDTTEMRGAAASIGSSAIASLATVEVTGQQGSNIFTVVPITLVGKFLPVVDEDRSCRGRPLCQKVIINTLSGYFQSPDPDISIACTNQERSLIQSYIIGGMYYE